MIYCRSVYNPVDDNAPKQNWYCVKLSYNDEYDIADTGFVWFNPHHYFWNVGYGKLVKNCNDSPPSVPSCADIPKRGENVLRSKFYSTSSIRVVA